MANYPYEELGTSFNREFIQGLNLNFDEVEQDIRDVAGPVSDIINENFDGAALAIAFQKKAQEAIAQIMPDYYKFKSETQLQLLQKVTRIIYDADMAYMNNRLNALTSGFKEGFDTYAALVAKYPTGVAGQYTVKADGNWYFWLEGSGWTSGGSFQSAGIPNESIVGKKIGRNAVDESNVSFIEKGTNMYTPDMMTKSFYIAVANGKLSYVASSTLDSVLIKVDPSTNYFFTTSDFLYYFFDINENVLGSGGNASATVNNIAITTPPGTAFVGVSIKKDNVNHGAFIFSQGTALPTTNIPSKLASRIVIGKEQITRNVQLFNPATLTESTYAYAQVGVPVTYGKSIIHNIGFSTGSTGAKPFVFYNEAGVKIQEKEYGAGVPIPAQIDVPVNAKTMTLNIFKSLPNFTFTKADADKVMVFEGYYMPTYYVPFGEDLDNIAFKPSYVERLKNEIAKGLLTKTVTVKKDGTGDYTMLRYALADAVGFYNIDLYPGTYDIKEEYSTAEWQDPAFFGYMTKKNVRIRGIGDYGTVILLGDLPAGTLASHVSRISTVHVVEGEFTMENVKLVGGNVRYALHDDDNRTRGFVLFERCFFLKEKNKGTYPSAVGGGWYDYETHKTFRKCHFQSDWDNMYKDHSAFAYHSRPNQTKSHRLILEDCSAQVTGQGSHVRFGGMKGSSGINSIIELTGNRFNRVYFFEEGYSPQGVDADVYGRGNSKDLEISFNINEGMAEPRLDFVDGVKMTPYGTNWTN